MIFTFLLFYSGHVLCFYYVLKYIFKVFFKFKNAVNSKVRRKNTIGFFNNEIL